ncbi:DUF418 domain-containing protein [Bacillus manliponensis]|uniref:DUF418 domain-containing protein n=1 Tax=Bacillus manliponensis TaxID=574376 RepID=UPI000A95BA0F|nr:DUF418 domain-containing protein [Bacillus manliponensis]
MRIRSLDVLRGFAILGTLGTNIWVFASNGNPTLIFTSEHLFSSLNAFLSQVWLFFVNGKLLGMLTIMFGIGLEIKYQKSLQKEQKWPGIYIWSSILLFIDGLLHYFLVMEFDVLMSYAITAIIVAFIVKAGTRVIKICLWIFGTIHILFFSLLSGVLMFTTDEFVMYNQQHIAKIYMNGSWFDQIMYRYQDFWALRAEAISIIPMNICLFLFGVLLMRSGVFTGDERGKRVRKKLLKLGLLIGLPLNLLSFVPNVGIQVMVRYFFAPFLTLAYMVIIIKLVEKGSLKWLTMRLEEIGKMALSCYVLQNILASIIFYGWGFGLSGKVESIGTIICWIVISVLLMIFANLWRRRFKSGPLEALWRYLTLLPFQKRKQNTKTM